MQKILIGLIKTYQYLLSPWIGNQCRFTPSCSHFAIEAINTHGAIKGSYLSIKRLFSCHPWHVGGYDPVPEKTVSDRQLKTAPSKSHG